MKRTVARTGLAIFLGYFSAFALTPAVADVLPAKKSGVVCDQGALTTYNAYMEAQRAVFQAFEAELTKAKLAYNLTMQAGTRSERKAAKGVLVAAQQTAIANRKAAVQQLGPKPKLPAGCKLPQN